MSQTRSARGAKVVDSQKEEKMADGLELTLSAEELAKLVEAIKGGAAKGGGAGEGDGEGDESGSAKGGGGCGALLSCGGGSAVVAF